MYICVDGTPGAGKSYYAAHYIEENYKKYSSVFTNLGGYKYHDNIKPLKWNDFLDTMTAAKAIYDDDGSDQDIWNYLFEVGFLNASEKEEIKPVLIVHDEAQNKYDQKYVLLTWVITYHRHMFLDVILTTQTYNLIHYSYHKLFENFIHAMPQSRVLFSKWFKYQKHVKVPFTDGKFSTRTGDVRLKKEDRIFDLYESGDKIRSKSSLNKFIYYAAGGLVASALLAVWMMRSYFTPPADESPAVASVSAPRSYRKYRDNTSQDYAGKHYVHLTCIASQCVDTKYHVYVRVDHLAALLKDTDSKYLSSIQHDRNLADIYLLASSDFLNLFKERNRGKSKAFNLIP